MARRSVDEVATTSRNATSSTGEREPERVELLEDRRRLVEERAYFAAERRGFRGGDPVHDWLEAEREVDAEIGGK